MQSIKSTLSHTHTHTHIKRLEEEEEEEEEEENHSNFTAILTENYPITAVHEYRAIVQHWRGRPLGGFIYN